MPLQPITDLTKGGKSLYLNPPPTVPIVSSRRFIADVRCQVEQLIGLNS